MREEARAEFELELDLNACIANEELVLHFQPIIDMVTSEIVGVEALVRWRHPVRGVLGPITFIPLAERTGAIIRIGEWVLTNAAKEFASWGRAAPESRALNVHVNVSTRQLADPSLVAFARHTFTAQGVDPSNFVLEITESALLASDVDLATSDDLKSLGVRLALDDFGTGYSSLSQLATLPVDELKIDKSFTDDVPSGPNRGLMAGVLALAGQLGTTTVVEGIEHQEQVRELLAMGARLGQGFLFSEPVSSADFLELLIARTVAPERGSNGDPRK